MLCKVVFNIVAISSLVLSIVIFSMYIKYAPKFFGLLFIAISFLVYSILLVIRKCIPEQLKPSKVEPEEAVTLENEHFQQLLPKIYRQDFTYLTHYIFFFMLSISIYWIGSCLYPTDTVQLIFMMPIPVGILSVIFAQPVWFFRRTNTDSQINFLYWLVGFAVLSSGMVSVWGIVGPGTRNQIMEESKECLLIEKGRPVWVEFFPQLFPCSTIDDFIITQGYLPNGLSFEKHEYQIVLNGTPTFDQDFKVYVSAQFHCNGIAKIKIKTFCIATYKTGDSAVDEGPLIYGRLTPGLSFWIVTIGGGILSFVVCIVANIIRSRNHPRLDFPPMPMGVMNKFPAPETPEEEPLLIKNPEEEPLLIQNLEEEHKED